MRYLAVCCDYDGTLATHGDVEPATFAALERLIASGRRVLLVTGRELDELATVCPRLDLFTCVVAENGALLYDPATRSETPLAPRPPERFITALRQRGVSPLSVGRVIVATHEPHETTVLEVIRDLGLALQVIFNKGSVMVLPAGVSKATGLAAALAKLKLSAHNTVGIGDAENDHALLAACELGAAVANALPALKEHADRVTGSAHGAGVAELCADLLRDDLAAWDPPRHHLLLGRDEAGREVRIAPHGERVLVLGDPQDTRPAVEGLLAQLTGKTYTFCAFTGEAPRAGLTGARTLPGVLHLGEPDRAPGVDEILEVLGGPCEESVQVSLAGLPARERSAFLSRLAAPLGDLRATSGRPHWIVVDAADELLPAAEALEDAHTAVYTARHPGALSRHLLSTMTQVMATGAAPHEAIGAFCRAAARPAPAMDPAAPGAALLWRPASGAAPRALSPLATFRLSAE